MALGHWLKDYIGPHSGGSGGGGTEPLIINNNNGTLDKTWQEIFDAMPNAVLVVSTSSKEAIMNVLYVEEQNKYSVNYKYETPNANGYPVDNNES